MRSGGVAPVGVWRTFWAVFGLYVLLGLVVVDGFMQCG